MEAVAKVTRLRLDSGRALPGVHKADFRLRPRHALPDEELFCGKAVGENCWPWATHDGPIFKGEPVCAGETGPSGPAREIGSILPVWVKTVVMSPVACTVGGPTVSGR